MKQRGRKSGDSKSVLAVIDGNRGSRASPPGDMNDYQAAKWAEIVGNMPADWFHAEMTDLLRAYCETSEICFEIQKTRQAMRPEPDDEPSDRVEVLKALLVLSDKWDKQARLLTTIATKLRLTPQSRTHPTTAARKLERSRAQAKAQPWDG